MEMKTASGEKCSVEFVNDKRTKLKCSFVVDIKNSDMLWKDPPKAQLLGILDCLNALAERAIADRNLLQAIDAELTKILPTFTPAEREPNIAKIIELVKSANMP